MKRLKRAVVLVLVFAIALGAFASLIQVIRHHSDLLPLIDENGNYSEEAFAANLASYKRGGLTLFENMGSEYVIIYPQGAQETLTGAVEDLATALTTVSGAAFEVYDDSRAPADKEICVGATNRVFSKAEEITDSAAYYLASEGARIFIYANSVYGASNGVYGFLEDYLGVMYMDQTYTYYPRLDKAVLSPLDDLQVPAFEVRDVYTRQTDNAKYRRQLRLTSNEVFSADGCHKSFYYISPEEYFDEHPEYFALLGGQRRVEDYMFQKSQLCWSNPEVIDLLAEGAERRIQSYEESGETRTIYWDFSQMDSMNRCQCSECKALEAQYGSPIAPILLAVNEIARRYPDYHFSTLAYHYGSVPPVGLIPEDNVLIKYCFMSEFGANDLSAPIGQAGSEISEKHYDEITGWGELTDNIYVWDYVTNYFNYLLPFPCFQSLQGNYQLLQECGVRGVFSLGAYNERGSSDCMKAYLISKLLWNPDADFDFLMNKYLTIYYGAAAPYVRQIYALQRQYLSGILWVYDFPLTHKQDYLSQSAVEQYTDLLDDAFAAVQNDEAITKRLRYEQLSLTYAEYKLGYGDTVQNLALLLTLCDEFGIRRFNEIGTDLVNDYR